VFHALAHDARRDMLRRLADRELTVGELAEPLEMSLPAVSKHLKVLEGAGLVDRERQGRDHVIRFRGEPLRLVSQWVHEYERFWLERLDRLEQYFREKREKDKEKGKKKP